MGHSTNSLNDNNIYSMCKTSSGDLYIGTPTGLNKYNHAKDDFTRIEKMGGIFIFDILEDHNGIIWFATYNSGVFKYNPRNQTWKNYSAQSTPARNCLPYNKVISIMEDSKEDYGLPCKEEVFAHSILNQKYLLIMTSHKDWQMMLFIKL